MAVVPRRKVIGGKSRSGGGGVLAAGPWVGGVVVAAGKPYCVRLSSFTPAGCMPGCGELLQQLSFPPARAFSTSSEGSPARRRRRLYVVAEETDFNKMPGGGEPARLRRRCGRQAKWEGTSPPEAAARPESSAGGDGRSESGAGFPRTDTTSARHSRFHRERRSAGPLVESRMPL